MKYGEMLKTIRLSAKLTQPDFAKKIGWTQSAISECENNNRIPSAKKHQQIVEFARVRKIKIDWSKIDWENVLSENNNEQN